MKPETRIELEKKLKENGLTVLITRDYDAILIQLARLAEFERLLQKYSRRFPIVACAIEKIREEQQRFVAADVDPVPMEILHIPGILSSLNRELHLQLDKQATIRPERINAAKAAFVGILTGR